jgi:pyruvate-formate lyase-activating enzyme
MIGLFVITFHLRPPLFHFQLPAVMIKTRTNPSRSTPFLLASDESGNVFEIPELLMTGMSLGKAVIPSPDNLLQLPPNSSLYMLPGRMLVGYDPVIKAYTTVSSYHGKPVFAVAAFLPPGYLSILSSSYRSCDNAPQLPFFCYTAVGWRNGKLYAAGMKIDRDIRQSLTPELVSKAKKRALSIRKKYKKNRLVQHLIENCVYKYECPNACNFVLGRFECPIPVSRSCNSSCIGCISQQSKSSKAPAPQHRIAFTPTVDEIVEYAVPHLEKAEKPMVSFGQGCEGEPLLEPDLLEESIKAIRKRTQRGIINLNTNGSKPSVIEKLCRIGLDSARVSMNSAQEKYYAAYYHPRNYSFEDVVESLSIIKKHRRWLSINYLMFPGFTDHPVEIKALEKLVDKASPDMIQTRNLNIDPEWFISRMELTDFSVKSIGIRQWMVRMKKHFPRMKLGYFNPSFKPH